MANTTTVKGNVIVITGLDEDWDWKTACPDLHYFQNLGALKVASIRFDPSATDDVMVIKERNDAGPDVFRKTAADVYDNEPFPYAGKRVNPYIDISECTLTTPADAQVTIELAE